MSNLKDSNCLKESKTSMPARANTPMQRRLEVKLTPIAQLLDCESCSSEKDEEIYVDDDDSLEGLQSVSDYESPIYPNF